MDNYNKIRNIHYDWLALQSSKVTFGGKIKTFIHLRDITHFEADSSGVNIHTINRRSPFFTYQTLGQVLSIVPEIHFAQINRSTIINLHRVTELDNSSVRIGNDLNGFGYTQTHKETFIKKLRAISFEL